MDRLLRLRLQPPADLTDTELRMALAGLSEHHDRLGPEHLPRLVRAGRDRLGLSWIELSRVTGYYLSTVFSWAQRVRDDNR